jgi:hypothetical protein
MVGTFEGKLLKLALANYFRMFNILVSLPELKVIVYNTKY